MRIMDSFRFLWNLKFNGNHVQFLVCVKPLGSRRSENHLDSRFAGCFRRLKIVSQKTFKTSSEYTLKIMKILRTASLGSNFTDS